MVDSRLDFNFKIVPDYHMERLFLKKEMSKALLRGRVVFVAGNKKYGSIYTFAKNHGMQAVIQKGDLDGVEGTFIKFVEIAQDTP